MNNTEYTWHYSMQGLPFPIITDRDRRLLPYVFTLIPTLTDRDSYFLWHFLFPPEDETRRLTGTLFYAVRTFLPYVAIRSIARLVVVTKV